MISDFDVAWNKWLADRNGRHVTDKEGRAYTRGYRDGLKDGEKATMTNDSSNEGAATVPADSAPNNEP